MQGHIFASRKKPLRSSQIWADACAGGGVGQRRKEEAAARLPFPKWAPPLSLVRRKEGKPESLLLPLSSLLRLVLMGAIFRGQQSH